VEITEVRIKLMEEPGERLQAFCSITFDHCFVIRDLKIIDGTNGPFVAMPSRKLTSHCFQCGAKNHMRSNFCNECGGKLNPNRAPVDEDGRAKLYADIAHPINSACREMIQERVIQEFHEELERAKQPDYMPRYDDYDMDEPPPPRYARGPARSHPTTHYARSGSEPASRVQAAEQSPRPPHKPTATAPSRSSGYRQEAYRPEADDRDTIPIREKPTSTGGDFGAGIF
jgi:stage V sporulation protein G